MREDRQHLLTRNAVHLVHGEQDGHTDVCELFQDVLLARPHLLRRIHDKDDDIDTVQRPIRRLCHIVAELVLRPMHTRRIEQDDLRILLRQNAEDTTARRLRLVAHNGDLLPDERVNQCGFADIRPPDHGDESGFMCIHREIPSSSITMRCSSSISRRSASSIWS